MHALSWVWRVLIVGTLCACAATAPVKLTATRPADPAYPAAMASAATATEPTALAPPAPLPPPLQQPGSRWVPVPWSELPGFSDDAWYDAWVAWLHSCERPLPPWTTLCPELRPLLLASPAEQRAWMQARLQPYRVEALDGGARGLLTGYYEPVLTARRARDDRYAVPLHRPPSGLAARKPWYTRQEIDTQPAPQAALRGREIAWLDDPLDALALQIQGSGLLRLTEPNGQQRTVRLAYAGSNDQPYRSVGRWLQDQGALTDASWPAIKAWAASHPQQVQALLWSNPRVVFFREEAVPASTTPEGPRGAQGVSLTAGRSIAVDRASIPYGTPVWLASDGPLLQLQKLVLAQDTGSAITGAVRADYFFGSGQEAGELAGRLKQPLRLWVLWPRGQ